MPTMAKENGVRVLRAVADHLAMSPEDFTAAHATTGIYS
jgi:hypothetical protein